MAGEDGSARQRTFRPPSDAPPYPEGRPVGSPVAPFPGQSSDGAVTPNRVAASPAADALVRWWTAPRPEVPPGVHPLGHRPRRRPTHSPAERRGILWRFLFSLLGLWAAWLYLIRWEIELLVRVLPDSWLVSGSTTVDLVRNGNAVAFLLLLMLIAAPVGRWADVARLWVVPALRRLVSAPPGGPTAGRGSDGGAIPREAVGTGHDGDPGALLWPRLSGGGYGEEGRLAAHRLAQDLLAGNLTEVDLARLERAFPSAAPKGEERHALHLPPADGAAALAGVARWGAAALPPADRPRELTHRVTVPEDHDLRTGRIRLGSVVDNRRNPFEQRGAGFALDPGALSTGLLVLGPLEGPRRSMPTGRAVVVRLVEALCRQALAGDGRVVVVGGPGGLVPEPAAAPWPGVGSLPGGRGEVDLGWFDVVIDPADRSCAWAIDPYGPVAEPGASAERLAEALLGNRVPSERLQNAGLVLRQLLDACQLAWNRFPSLHELRLLLTPGPAVPSGPGHREPPAAGTLRSGAGVPGTDGDLLERLEGDLRAAQADPAEIRAILTDLAMRRRAAAFADDVGALLADRLALLDRPGLAGFLTHGPGHEAEHQADTAGGAPRRPWTPGAPDGPARVLVRLPEHTHAQASEILRRLIASQFAAAVTVPRGGPAGGSTAAPGDFNHLVLDDAASAVGPLLLRQMPRLRHAGAGTVFLVRHMADLPEALADTLLASTGCRMALPGITPGDAERLAALWGTGPVEERSITSTADTSGGVVRRSLRGLWSLLTGAPATRRSVTVRTVRRELFSAAELAHELVPGYLVCSVSDADGRRVRPMAVRVSGGDD
ncbi:hypothetical protein [Allostreptomyces psammosilenae]|uniref:ATP-binding protein n=1 Tax=Allostreptomyces psammosilenae TaxID=1892865 RepID=A0A853AD01_9ACTN|nr:hypothetical protein [Allostreptomyces psammosilenae]NYI08431.1 hypothetical protein [Allostreptomyces psammosilenae]